MLGLHIDHRERVVKCDACALVDRQMKIRMRLADGETLPQLALAVINHRPRGTEHLRIQIHHTLADRMPFFHRLRLQRINLAQLPRDDRRTIALAAEIDELVAVRFLELVGKFLLVMFVVRHEQILGTEERPLHVGDARFIAFEILNHEI